MEGTDGILKADSVHPQHRTRQLDGNVLDQFVASFLDRKDNFLRAIQVGGSPLYVIEGDILRQRIVRIEKAFGRFLPQIRLFYAMKSNYHPEIIRILVNDGVGIDVSSGWELTRALEAGAGAVVFSGPGKTVEELRLAVKAAERVTVLMDSFGELGQLQQGAGRSDTVISAGVRLTTDDSGLWRKFGIPLKRINEFFAAAEKCPNIRLQGLQFHTSWNLVPDNQVAFIERLGRCLQKLPRNYRDRVKFIDIGGGYWPEPGEWMQYTATPEGSTDSRINDTVPDPLTHYALKADKIEYFAEQISRALEKHVFPLVGCRIYIEPGRWICNDAMHILATVIDKKADDLVITDGATNAVGWERFESDYFPLINLTQPQRQERPCLVVGSLCTPHDVWGYSYFGSGIEVGDVLMVPTQGAYTYSLRQQFIKPLPDTVVIETDSDTDAQSLRTYSSSENTGSPDKKCNFDGSIDKKLPKNNIWKKIKNSLLPRSHAAPQFRLRNRERI